MDSASVYGKGIAFPPRVGSDGRMAWSEGEDNVREAIRVILMTEPGERLRLPAFGAGLGRMLFEPNILATHTLIRQRIQDALARWEPRVRVESVEVEADAIDPQAAIATITYRLVATQAQERVAVAVSVGTGRS
jgi:phage baseplate assembly protein W